MIKNDLTGKQFNKWKVIKLDYERTNSSRGVYYICECQCDNKTIKSIYASNLTSNKTKSCGCLKRENVSKANHKTNKYNINNEYGIGYSNNNEEFYFDLEDYDKIKDYCWHINKKYACTKYKNNRIMMHRLIMNCPKDKVVDHINGNTLDNRKSNLRICTQHENSYNKVKGKNNTSGYKGVSWDKNANKWSVRLHNKYLGLYNSLEEAVKVSKEFDKNEYGEFSVYARDNNLIYSRAK